MLLWRLGGVLRYRGSTSKLHEVASFSCILVQIVKFFLIPDDVGIFPTTFTFPKIWGDDRLFQGVGLR